MNIEVKFRDPIIFLFTGKARHGKDTAAGCLKECFEKDNKKVIFSQYAKYIKFYCKEMYGWDGSEETKPRELLQKLGTEVIRNKLDKAEMFIQRQVDDVEIYSYFYDAIMVSDIRLPREIEGLKEKYKKVVVINIFRPNFESELSSEQKKHITETAMDNYTDYDYKIVNITLENLKEDMLNIYNIEINKYK